MRIDLELWAVQEEADLARAELPRMSRLIEQSLKAIRDFVAAGPCYCSVSWGKDSVVLAHLVHLSRCRMQLVNLHAEPVCNPDTRLVRDAFLMRWPSDYVEEIVDYRSIDSRCLDEIEHEKDRLFFGSFRRFGSRHISGIRADESGGRKIRMRRWGLASESACAPLGWWQGDDVFAYAAAHQLPLHPAYAMQGNGRWERRHIRVDELGGQRGDCFGRAEWEREYYGDALRRLEARTRVAPQPPG
jgi:phosphoadenosine phosphosulfate reductase